MPKEQGADYKHDCGTRLEGEIDSFASQTARETSLAKKTGEIFSGVGRQAQTSYSKAMENEKARSCSLSLTTVVQLSQITEGVQHLVSEVQNATSPTAEHQNDHNGKCSLGLSRIP